MSPPVKEAPPPSLKRQYPHVDGVEDWRAQQTIRLLWDRTFDLESRLQTTERVQEEGEGTPGPPGPEGPAGPAGPRGPSGVSGLITRETPVGAVNGVNTVFTLANTPIVGSEEVYLNGLLQEPGAGNDYTISGATITYLTAPLATDRLRVSYRI